MGGIFESKWSVAIREEDWDFVLYETPQSEVGLGEPCSNVGARQGIAKFVNKINQQRATGGTYVNKLAGSY